MSDHPVSPAVHTSDAVPVAAPRFAALRRAALPVAAIAVVGAGVGVAMATVTMPAFVATHGIAILIAVAGGVMAIRWIRGGVRRRIREGARAQIAEFGGGIYGSIAFATLLYLEAMDLVGDVAAVGSLGAFLESLSFGWLMAQAMESVGFAIRAMMWPWHWFSGMGAAAAGLVAGAVWALQGAAPKLREWRAARRGGVAGAEETP